jgi:hypothetical protein
MVHAPLARVWLGGVSAMGDFDKKFGEKSCCFSFVRRLGLIERRGCHVVWIWTMHECGRLKEGVWSTVGLILFCDDAN